MKRYRFRVDTYFEARDDVEAREVLRRLPASCRREGVVHEVLADQQPRPIHYPDGWRFPIESSWWSAENETEWRLNATRALRVLEAEYPGLDTGVLAVVCGSVHCILVRFEDAKRLTQREVVELNAALRSIQALCDVARRPLQALCSRLERLFPDDPP